MFPKNVLLSLVYIIMVYLKCCIIPDLTTNCKPVTEVSFIVEVKG